MAIDNFAAKFSVNKDDFTSWKNKVLHLVDQRVEILKSKMVLSVTKPVLEGEEALSALTDLHSNFVVVPIDKASNNVAIICKRFYVQKLLDEVGVPGDMSPTYKISDRNPEDVIADNTILRKIWSLYR